MENMFSKNIEYLINSGKLTAKQMLKIIGKNSISIIYMWKSGERFITTEDAVKLCNYLGITINDLINGNLRELENSYDDLEELFIQHKDLLTDDDRDTIRFIIEKRIKEHDTQR